MMTCAHDGCTVTAEFKKGKYTYYRCSGGRGKCELPYFREEEISKRLGTVLQDIQIPDDILDQLKNSLISDTIRQADAVHSQKQRLEQRLVALRHRIEQAYLDKLDGKIPEDFWSRKSAEWRAEEQQIANAIQALVVVKPERALEAARILELANKAYSLYLSQNPAEQAKLLKMVLSNCSVDAVNVYPNYRKPFDLIFNRAKTGEWSGRRDLNPGPLAPQAERRDSPFFLDSKLVLP
jgi:site-specific DNA recombinase